MRFYKLDAADITVFHDEIDLAPAKLRVKQGGGHAGHNGLRSLHGHIGDGYVRVRMGVGHPGHKDRVPGYVLHDFAKADEAWLDDMLRGVSKGAPDLAAGDTGRFMNAVALQVNPPRSSAGGQDKPKSKQADKAPFDRQPQDDPPNAANKPGEGSSSDARSPLQKLVDRFR